MNNIVIGLKRFFTNKNVITIILVLVILIVLYIGYSTSIKSQTKPVSLPVAARTINPKTQITNEDIKYKNVPESMLGDGVLRYPGLIVGKYTNINVTIPEDSVFYGEWIVEGEDIHGNWIEELDYEKGELGYYMDVDVESTLGNSVLPNTYIDIYMKATDENGTIMFGKLMKNVKVLVVHDSNGENVFANSSNIGSPSKIGFAVSQDYYILLQKASYLDLELIIAPRGSTVPTKDYVIVTSATLRDYIDAHTITVKEDEVEEPKEENKEETKTEDTATNTENSEENNQVQAEQIQ